MDKISGVRHLIGAFGKLIVGWWLMSASLVVASVPVTYAEEAPMAAVQDNMDVGLEYTLTVDGVVVDSTEGKTPLHYVHGKSQIIPGLERQLAGMHVGDSKEVTVAPEEGYGPMDPSAVVEVGKAQLPPDVQPSVGMVLRGVNPDGKSFRAMIKEVKDNSVMLDLNHPLAGKTLTFEVKISTIAPAAASTTGGPGPAAVP